MSTPANPGRNGQKDDEGVEKRRELRHEDQVDERDGEDQAQSEAPERGAHPLDRSPQIHADAGRQIRAGHDAVHCRGESSEILAGRRDEDVDHPPELIVVDLGRRVSIGSIFTTGIELRGIRAAGGAERNLLQVGGERIWFSLYWTVSM